MMNTTGEIRTADSAPVVVSSGYVWYSPADWWRFLKRWPILPVLVLVAVVLGAVFAKQISPHEPDKGNLRERDIPPLWFEGSSTEHPLGTNNLGQDMLVRVLEGARVSLVVASVAFTGLLSFTLNVSPSASSTVSFAVTTVTVFVVAPASNVSAPLVDV